MFSLVDTGGVLVAVVLAGVLVALPGLALARLFGLARIEGVGQPLLGPVVGLAALPVLASLATRGLGLDAALALDLALALAGLVLLCRDRDLRRMPGAAAAGVLACWLVLLVVEWIDFDVAGRLYQPLTIVDTVKHAATTQAILDSGAPPRDAFFLRPERASYYYFFYTLSALVARASLGLADAKAAVGGLIFWVGLGLYGLVRLVLERAGLVLQSTGARRMLLILAVLAAGGLDIVIDLLLTAVNHGLWVPDPFWWNEQVSMWSDSVLWTPHHVTALIASLVGLVALSDLAETRKAAAGLRKAAAGLRKAAVGLRKGAAGLRKDAAGLRKGAAGLRKSVLAALAFASTLGLSVWVALALVASAAVWGLVLLVERRWRALGFVAIAGLAALLLAAPVLCDLHAGRGGPLPIAFEVRAFALVDAHVPSGPWRSLARFAALPLNYLLEFGAVAVGSVLFWRDRGSVPASSEFSRLLAIAAGTALVLGTLLCSRLHNNDLGWRVMLFPLLAGVVWTIAVADRALAVRAAETPVWRSLPPRLALCLAIGWATSLATFVSMRAYPWLRTIPELRFMAADPQTDHALRAAYAWADSNLPAAAVLQHNPAATRAFAFGAYGRHPIAVSDGFADLYGAPPEVVEARIAALAPVYRRTVPAADIRSVAARAGINDLVVTASDPVWRDRSSFVWTSVPVYASERVRIIPVARLGG